MMMTIKVRSVLTALLAVSTLTACTVVSGHSEEIAKTPSDSVLIRVIDGDTIAVKPTSRLPATNEQGTEHVVRLLGIDTPEMNYTSGNPECGAKGATSNLKAVLPKDTGVTVTYDARSDHTDRYGRSLAYVGFKNPETPFTDAAMAQTTLGYAEAWYPKGEPVPERFSNYQQAAETAQIEGHGSWAQCDTLGR